MIANAVMFHTVANQTNVLNQLANEEIEYDNDSLSILSAFFRENINRYGICELSKPKTSMPLKFNIQGKKTNMTFFNQNPGPGSNLLSKLQRFKQPVG